MRMNLNVLEHLGINLYSNVPAVLSEVVANSWDADAASVEITLGSGQITIKDTGDGMDRAEVNARFLTVGYRRRQSQPAVSAKGRRPMGRKGIGKLSLFSIANIVEVHTVRNGEKSAFRMEVPKIRQCIAAGNYTYEPEELDVNLVDFSEGTRIILRDLRRQETIKTAPALRKRLARRFSIIGAAQGFEVRVDGQSITPADRDYFNRIQYLFTYGDQSDVVALCTNLGRPAQNRSVDGLDPSISLSGWIGTVKESKDLKDDEGDNLNRIAIYVRGKMAQEDMLADFSERGVYASYLLGELRVDELDADDQDDAATSSRQRLVEDDPRYLALKKFVGEELKYIQSRWGEWQKEDGAAQAMTIPAVADWVLGLPKEYQSRAKAWIGKINKITPDDPSERKNLVKHAILAFEFYKANESLEKLDSLTEVAADELMKLFAQLDSLEANLYGQIVQQRLSVIRTLKEHVDKNELEKIIQQLIFDKLWLLDPAWERTDAPALMEQRVDKLFEEIEAGLTPEEKAARIDIKYRKTAGEHLVIELKRPSRVVSVYELAAQVGKYRTGMKKILEAMGKDEPVEFICLLGKHPKEWNDPNGKEVVTKTLAAQNARVVLYDEMLDNAFQSYSDYLKERKVVDKLGEIIKAIEDYAPEDEDGSLVAA